MSLSGIDWVVVAAYVLVLVGLGYWGMRRVKDAGGFLLANRRMGKWLMVAQTFSGGINSTDPMTVAAGSYRTGLSGMWYSLVYIFATPFFWMWPPIVRRMRVVTVVDMYRMRFGRVFEWVNIVLWAVKEPLAIGGGIKAAALMVVVMAGSHADASKGVAPANAAATTAATTAAATTTAVDTPAIGMHTAVAMIVLPTLLYTLLGGVHAVAATDLFQGLLIIVLSFVALPFIVMKVGGMAEVSARVNAAVPDAWSLVNQSGLSYAWLVWFVVGVVAAAPLVYGWSSGAARNEMAARWQILGNLGKRFCTVGWGLAGLFAIAVYVGQERAALLAGKGADGIFARVAIDSLPSGLRGVMVASMLAAVMSTIAGMMLGFGGVMVNNVYKNYFVAGASPGHYLTMARVFTALPVLFAWVVATSDLSLPNLFVIVQQINGITGIAVLAAITWRRTTGYAAIAAALTAGPLFVIGQWKVADWPAWYRAIADGVLAGYHAVGLNPGLTLSGGLQGNEVLQVTNPIYLITGVVVLIAVSLLTPQHDRRTVDEFYARLDTPVGDEDQLRAAGYQADTLEELDKAELNADEKDRDTSRRLLLLDLFRWPRLLLRGEARLGDWWVDLAGVAGSVVFIVAFFYGIKLLAGALSHP
jgi:SSS family solute:Na+ symporter